MGKIKHTLLKFSDLVFMEDNPRRISEADFEALAESIRKDPEFFENRPCLVNHTDGKYLVYAGFQRAHAAHHRLGWADIPCSIQADVPEAVMRERAIRDNTHQGTWNADVLSSWDFEVPELQAFGVPDFVFGEPDNSLNSEKLEAQDDGYEIPDEIKTDIVTGDLFEIGPHRLLCGDSTIADDVGRLMNGERADLMVTDPPYGVKYTGKTKKALTIENDSLTAEQTHQLWRDCLNTAICFLVPGSGIYATVPPGLLQFGFMEAMLNAECLRQCMVWDKGQMVLGHSDYHYAHEPILYGWVPGAAHYFTSDRTKTTVFRYPKPIRNADHPTMKPVELWAEMVGNSSNENNKVYDPFLGSGTTMVAAHQLNRRCYGMEIDPKYCQVIVDRMIKLDPTLEIKRNGQIYGKTEY